MTARSSAWFISYDIRPSKQIERRLVFESLQSAAVAGLSVSEKPFIGMGGVRFVDFLLANRLLGIRRFESIEHDADILARCVFNRPFHDIAVFDGNSSEYIAAKGFQEPAIVWFDYERGVSTDLKDDMISLSGSVRPGTFVFVTATAELPPALRSINGLGKRLEQLRVDIDPLGSGLLEESVNPKHFHETAARILIAALRFGFAGRSDGRFYPYLRLNYKDSTWMMTVGGYFGVEKDIRVLRESLRVKCPFLKPDDHEFVYAIRQFNITDAERRLFDRATIAGKHRRSEKMALRRMGFTDGTIDQYAELMRFIPRYFESAL